MKTRQQEIDSIEKRAVAARVTMTDVCAEAGVDYSTWYRAKQNPEGLRVKKLGEIEAALGRLEKQRAEA